MVHRGQSGVDPTTSPGDGWPTIPTMDVSLCGVMEQYGLIGRNGVGKTTLLRHMAAYDIEGFPRHHRVMHVRQEIKPSEKSVLQVRAPLTVPEQNGVSRDHHRSRGGGVTVSGALWQ